MPLFDRLWLLVSQALNALCFSGDPDESLSARSYRQGQTDATWAARRARIDRALGAGHCKAVYELQLQRQKARGE